MINLSSNRSQQRITSVIKPVIQRPWFAISSRVIAAIAGGYVLSNLMAILLSYLLSTLLAGTPADSVMTAMLLSYLLYAVIVIWVFSGKTLLQIWRTLTLTCLVCTFLVYFFKPEGLF